MKRRTAYISIAATLCAAALLIGGIAFLQWREAQIPRTFSETIAQKSHNHLKIERTEVFPGDIRPESVDGVAEFSLGIREARATVNGIAESSGMKIGKCQSRIDPIPLTQHWPSEYRDKVRDGNGRLGLECTMRFLNQSFGSYTIVEFNEDASFVEYSVGGDGYVSDQLQ